ncbi:MAG: hypothetical protein AAF481_14060 [Acidobacteriota bacterium]
MSRDLENVIALHHTLVSLEEARRQLNEIPDWMSELHAEHTAIRLEIEELEAKADEAGQQRRAAEAAIEDAQEKLKRYQQQINAVTTQREYGALLSEIDAVKNQIAGEEEQGIAALEGAEAARKEAEEKRASFQELDDRYSSELAKWEAEKPSVAERVAALEAEETEARKAVPRPIASLFERIRDRSAGVALAAVRIMERPGGKGPREWHCAVCNYRVRPQAVVDIRNNSAIVQCDGCKRILYLEEQNENGTV